MAYTIDQLTVLKAAIAQGARVVEYADKKVEYRTLSEMLQIQRQMEAELFPIPKKSYRQYAEFSKGL